MSERNVDEALEICSPDRTRCWEAEAIAPHDRCIDSRAHRITDVSRRTAGECGSYSRDRQLPLEYLGHVVPGSELPYAPRCQHSVQPASNSRQICRDPGSINYPRAARTSAVINSWAVYGAAGSGGNKQGAGVAILGPLRITFSLHVPGVNEEKDFYVLNSPGSRTAVTNVDAALVTANVLAQHVPGVALMFLPATKVVRALGACGGLGDLLRHLQCVERSLQSVSTARRWSGCGDDDFTYHQRRHVDLQGQHQSLGQPGNASIGRRTAL